MTDRHAQNQPEQDTRSAPDAGNRKGVISIVIAVVLVVILAVVLWLWQSDDDSAVSERRPVPQPVQERVEPEPQPQRPQPSEPDTEVVVPEPAPIRPTPAMDEPQAPELELPDLNESTEFVIEQARERELNTRPIRSEHLVRDLVIFVHNLSDGDVIRESATIAGPDARFSTQTVDNQLYIDERTYARYNEIVEWFVGLDSQRLVRAYRDFEPLFAQAFSEIAHPDQAFIDEIIEAIDVLLTTPEPEGMLALEDDRVMYTFADPELEQLPAAQKQMLRMGLDNQRRVKRKLREVRALLVEQR